MTPWEVEIHHARRDRGGKSHQDEARVHAKAYAETKAEARTMMKEEMASRATSWETGGAYQFNVHGRIRKVDHVPGTKAPKARPPPAHRTPKGYYVGRDGVRVGRKEAQRRNRISASQRARWTLIRKAARTPGVFKEKELLPMDYFEDQMEDDFERFDPGAIAEEEE